VSEATIKFSCECGKAYKVPDKFAGKRVKCKNCGETVAVPSASEQINSARAAAVSQRSVVNSKRLEKDDDDDDDDDEAPRSSSKHPSRSGSGKTASSSGRVTPSSSGKVPQIKPQVARPASTAPARKPNTDTQVIDTPDITPDMKKYVKKRDEEMAKATGKLVLFEDGKATKSFRLDKDDKTLGRGSSCDIKLEAKTISKAHLKFEYKLGTFLATDTSSTNGLVVNGKKVRRASLKDGDVLQLGDVVLRIDCAK
jgi:hypothetical protein